MSNLRARVGKLEERAAPLPHTGVFRIIKDGDFTPDQEAQVAAADAAGMLVIIREIVHPTH